MSIYNISYSYIIITILTMPWQPGRWPVLLHVPNLTRWDRWDLPGIPGLKNPLCFHGDL